MASIMMVNTIPVNPAQRYWILKIWIFVQPSLGVMIFSESQGGNAIKTQAGVSGGNAIKTQASFCGWLDPKNAAIIIHQKSIIWKKMGPRHLTIFKNSEMLWQELLLMGHNEAFFGTGTSPSLVEECHTTGFLFWCKLPKFQWIQLNSWRIADDVCMHLKSMKRPALFSREETGNLPTFCESLQLKSRNVQQCEWLPRSS